MGQLAVCGKITKKRDKGLTYVDSEPKIDDNNGHKKEPLIQRIYREVSYKKGTLLNQSAFSSIYETLNMNTGELLAIKTYTPVNKDEIDKSIDYINKKVEGKKHFNILEYFDVILNPTDNEVCVISELIPGYSVEALIEKFGRFDENVSRIFIKQAIEGLAYLHTHKTAHGNLKSSNILIDNTGVAKICDFFYLSRSVLNPHNLAEANKPQKIFCYSSPEVLLESKRHLENDIWAMGCILVEMLTGEKPWGLYHLNHKYIKEQMQKGAMPPLPSRISTACKDFLTKIFNHDKNKRPSAQLLLDSEFMKTMSDFERDDGLMVISGVNFAGLKSISISKKNVNIGKSMVFSVLPPNLKGNLNTSLGLGNLGTSFNYQGLKQLKTIKDDPSKQELAKLKTFMINDGIKRQGTMHADNFKPRNEDESKKINDYLEMNRKKFEEDLLKQLQFFEDTEEENGENGNTVHEDDHEEEGIVD